MSTEDRGGINKARLLISCMFITYCLVLVDFNLNRYNDEYVVYKGENKDEIQIFQLPGLQI